MSLDLFSQPEALNEATRDVVERAVASFVGLKYLTTEARVHAINEIRRALATMPTVTRKHYIAVAADTTG